MHFDDSFSNRVALARSAIGLTQEELAKKVGIVRRQIAAYEGGDAKPREQALNNLAAALGTTVTWLTSGEGTGPNVSNIKRTVTVREIPVVSYHSGIDGFFDLNLANDFIPAPKDVGESAFAIKVEGDSMTSTIGASFPDGYMVCFDPDIGYQSGDFVLCIIDDIAMFKQLIIAKDNTFLKSLNPAYPTLIANKDTSIIAAAVHSQMDLRGGSKRSINIDTPLSANILQTKDIPLEPQEYWEKLEKIESKLDQILNALTSSSI
ncbi:hypothetical protein B4P00_20105 [Shewanella xiamenensis]|uniref:LexA family protein n=1 Tax=Shewanella xiamenensis TaxID=332186 RepID=UPI001C4DEF09|nr:S24 family peptidase [Shewanella xiamenensis]MBW0298493.1 hypothetical protein [Shewanella xiamenensis]